MTTPDTTCQHKSSNIIDDGDLKLVCEECGLSTQLSTLSKKKPSEWIGEHVSDISRQKAFEYGQVIFHIPEPSHWEQAILDYLDSQA